MGEKGLGEFISCTWKSSGKVEQHERQSAQCNSSIVTLNSLILNNALSDRVRATSVQGPYSYGVQRYKLYKSLITILFRIQMRNHILALECFLLFASEATAPIRPQVFPLAQIPRSFASLLSSLAPPFQKPPVALRFLSLNAQGAAPRHNERTVWLFSINPNN